MAASVSGPRPQQPITTGPRALTGNHDQSGRASVGARGGEAGSQSLESAIHHREEKQEELSLRNRL